MTRATLRARRGLLEAAALAALTGLHPTPLQAEPAEDSSAYSVIAEAVAEAPEAADAQGAYEALEKRRWDAVLLDLSMPGEHGLDALVRIREQAPDTAVLVVSGESTIVNAVKAGQRGAFDFVAKPPDPEHLLEVIREAVKVTRLRRGAAEAAGAAAKPGSGELATAELAADGATLGIVGSCPAIEKLREAFASYQKQKASGAAPAVSSH